MCAVSVLQRYKPWKGLLSILTRFQIRQRAASVALETVNRQMAEMSEWGLLADWSNTYVTIS